MQTLINYLRRLRERQNKKERRRRISEICAGFDIAESEGQIYILCGCTAVARIPENATAAQIAASLNTARSEALRYAGLEETTSTTTNP